MMAVKSLSKSLAVGIIFLNTVLAFQNCSRSNFEFQSADLSSNVDKESVIPNSPFSLVSNTAIKPLVCQSSNQVELKIELNKNYSYECSDISYKNPSLKTGLTCTSGVEIPSTIRTNTSWVSCSAVSLCGVQPSAVKQINGTTSDYVAFELTYKNLPWGCSGIIQSRFVSAIDEESSTLNAEVSIDINPPSCKTCSDSSATCGDCPTPTPTPTNKSCTLNSKAIAHGSSITTYKSSSVAYGSSCTSETRTCNNGSLSGTYTAESCSIEQAKSCALNGQTIAHGSSVTAYQTSSVAFGGTCSSQSRTCSNGTLSGSYSASSCAVETAKACTFNGQTIAHGSSVTAYQASSVAFGSTCTSQSRTCSNGTLSGSYSAGSCSVEAAKACTFNGQTIAHGSSVTAYQTSSVAFGSTCTSQSRTCSNGTLSGSYSASSCSVEAAKACTTPWGTTIAHGATVTGYTASSIVEPGSCDTLKASLSCYNGQTSGAAKVGTCSQTAYVCPTRGSVQAWGSSMTPTDINGLKGYVKGVGYCLYQGNMGGDPYCSVYNFSGNYVNAGKYCNDALKVSKFKIALYNWDTRSSVMPCDPLYPTTLSGNEAQCYRGFVPTNVIVNKTTNIVSECTGEKGNRCHDVTYTTVDSVTFDCTDGEQTFSCRATARPSNSKDK